MNERVRANNGRVTTNERIATRWMRRDERSVARFHAGTLEVMIVCHNCGNLLDETVRNCSACGALVSGSASNGSAKGSPKANRSDWADKPLRVFLCHSSTDEEVVLGLYKRLVQDGFQPWTNEKDLLPGQVWREEVNKVVRASDVFVVCLSPEFIGRAGFGQTELNLALDVAAEQPEDTIFIIPLKLVECDIPPRLSRWQCESLFAEDGYERLKEALRHRRAGPKSTLVNPPVANVEAPVRHETRTGNQKEKSVPLRIWCGVKQQRRTILLVLLGVILVLAACLILYTYPARNPKITIIEIPPYDSVGGPDTSANIAGEASGVDFQDVRVVIYSFTDKWYVEPEEDKPFTPVGSDGRWNSSIHTGAKYAALLVKSTFKPLTKIPSLPNVQGKVLAIKIEPGRQ
jgi:hypothetical protein